MTASKDPLFSRKINRVLSEMSGKDLMRHKAILRVQRVLDKKTKCRNNNVCNSFEPSDEKSIKISRGNFKSNL